MILFHNEHSARGLERASVEGVEIDAAGNRLPDSVFTVPIGGSFSRQIAPCFLDPEIQLTGQLPPEVVDAKGHWRSDR